MIDHPNLALMKRALDAFRAGDVPTLAQVFAKDVVWHVPGKSFLAKDYPGQEEVFGFFGRLMESEIATPAPHIGSQSRHRRVQAHAFGLPCDFPNSFLEPLDRLRRNPTPKVRAVAETESEKLLLLRSRHRALRVVDLPFWALAEWAAKAKI